MAVFPWLLGIRRSWLSGVLCSATVACDSFRDSEGYRNVCDALLTHLNTKSWRLATRGGAFHSVRSQGWTSWTRFSLLHLHSQVRFRFSVRWSATSTWVLRIRINFSHLQFHYAGIMQISLLMPPKHHRFFKASRFIPTNIEIYSKKPYDCVIIVRLLINFPHL